MKNEQDYTRYMVETQRENERKDELLKYTEDSKTTYKGEFKMNKNNLMVTIIETLNDLGIPANILGYEYLKEALKLTVGDKTFINSMSQRLYPAVAKEYGTTPSRVERAIRHAIELTFDNLSPEVLSKYFGNCTNYYKGKTTNSQFIAIVAEKIRIFMGVYDESKQS